MKNTTKVGDRVVLIEDLSIRTELPVVAIIPAGTKGVVSEVYMADTSALIKFGSYFECVQWEKLDKVETLSIGSFFEDLIEGEIYILAQVDPSKVALINMESGNRFSHPTLVGSCSDISLVEWGKVCNGAQERFLRCDIKVSRNG